MISKIRHIQISEHISRIVCNVCGEVLTEHLPLHTEKNIPDNCPNCGQKIKGESK